MFHNCWEHSSMVKLPVWLRIRISRCSGKVCAADYGVPQTRIRAIIIGSRVGDPSVLFPPRKTHYNPNGNGRYQNTLDFPGTVTSFQNLRNGVRYAMLFRICQCLKVLIFETMPHPLICNSAAHYADECKTIQGHSKGRNEQFDLQRRAPEITPKCWIRKKSGGTDLFGRLWWNRPAVTMRTEFYKPEKGRYLHPEQHRPITHREAARFQSFPDSFIFSGSKIEIAKQIGNAVPPFWLLVLPTWFTFFLQRVNMWTFSINQTKLDHVTCQRQGYKAGNYSSFHCSRARFPFS